jgi:hypothetical protein
MRRRPAAGRDPAACDGVKAAFGAEARDGGADDFSGVPLLGTAATTSLISALLT